MRKLMLKERSNFSKFPQLVKGEPGLNLSLWDSAAQALNSMLYSTADTTRTNGSLRIFCNFPVQFSSVTKSCQTLWDSCSTAGFTVLHQLPELAQTHGHRVGNAIQPSHSLSSPSPAFNLHQHQCLFQWVSSSNQVAKVLELQFYYQSSQWIFRTDFL